MTGFCLDTGVISAVLKPAPPMVLVRRLAVIPPARQFTTAITTGELVYGAARRGNARLWSVSTRRSPRRLSCCRSTSPAARVYGSLRVTLERAGTTLAEPDLRIASIALANELSLVTGNVRRFERVPGLTVENWLAVP